MKNLIIILLVFASLPGCAQTTPLLNSAGDLVIVDTSATPRTVIVLGPGLSNPFKGRTDTVGINLNTPPAPVSIIQQPDQKAVKGQTKFTFLNVPASFGDFMIFRNGIPKSHTSLNITGTRGFTVSGNDIFITDAVAGDIIHYVQLR